MTLPRQPGAGTALLRLAAGLGAVLLAVGVWGTLVREVSFGWTSYTPLTSGASGPRTVVLDAPGLLALVALVVGTALVAGAAGYALARRRVDM
ncbi:hypothetical protein SAMN05216184_101401 [Georgenia satyanarayanai]|uniref:Uncharacterized protein n=1 Tax=Georgenia satyanarayanai TaxID=860221 RepID=A0A2Y9A2J8_9MICO|nr:hypothetical protein [Georgenia satyanarayanai]PYG01936.1 hypothetical protein A8987_101401 [Georgenia satyanarayanai]SSA36739.1 hypothetical protein SAMN05216184_101401 [Georgenia satyanarayanai]